MKDGFDKSSVVEHIDEIKPGYGKKVVKIICPLKSQQMEEGYTRCFVKMESGRDAGTVYFTVQTQFGRASVRRGQKTRPVKEQKRVKKKKPKKEAGMVWNRD